MDYPSLISIILLTKALISMYRTKPNNIFQNDTDRFYDEK